ncbi:tRNA pseudouridine(55) synthase TruB [Gryllotalpicola protaetiae]|uniref:tRNA pseudouridine synthase B n=1 Tax=Gryllotalpicola protaetiae TaxID=2419771 RepID=A0A387BK17_9MICO|nr:tRNA pseudouridine(55) synthase TruB [Gryllotalpicola protaetiae]AYG04485.1 tRNA pseudouridine(55) synthase TruB [Gryllotalpicola protaetiae]
MSEAAPSGILLVDKPQGLTSHDVVARIRRAANTRKVGHAGTLDPMATGLLIVGIGTATRLLTHVVGTDKVYEATIRLGESTVTDDAEGDVVERAEAGVVDAVGDVAIAAGIRTLTGPIEQVPSTVSAIKVDGKRAYARARAGEEVELAARPVTIHEFELRATRRMPGLIDLDVRVACSSGTYIRALARDLGRALGVGGHLTMLRRTSVGPFSVVDATALESLADGSVPVASVLQGPADAAGRLFPVLELDPQQAVDLGHGKKLQVEATEQPGIRAAIGPSGRLVALATVSATGVVRVETGFPNEES